MVLRHVAAGWSSVALSAQSETVGAGAKMPVRLQRQVSTKAVTRAGHDCSMPGSSHTDAETASLGEQERRPGAGAGLTSDFSYEMKAVALLRVLS
jgi:hypothetical protein